jgi:hypothetical protein
VKFLRHGRWLRNRKTRPLNPKQPRENLKLLKETKRQQKVIFIFRSETVSSESDDGISVISESELCKTLSENEVEKCEEETATEAMEDPEFQMPPTPPATPILKVEKEQFKEYETSPAFRTIRDISIVFNCGLVIVLICYIFYSFFGRMHREINSNIQRITNLEEENRMLKIQLDQLTNIVNPVEAVTEDQLEFLDKEEPRAPPPTKTVWLGSETEHKVEILDKKYELPDYCYQTQEEDLFYEYNQAICEEKRRKLEKSKSAKQKKKKSLDKYPEFDRSGDWTEKDYDEYIAQALKDMTAEIDAVKRRRLQEAEATKEEDPENPEFSPNEAQPEKTSKSKRKKQKRKERNWIQDRGQGREEARKIHEKEGKENENWYLKRKNNGKINREEF